MSSNTIEVMPTSKCKEDVMKNSAPRFGGSVGLLGLVVLLAVSGLSVMRQAPDRPSAPGEFNPFGYLPPGSKIKDRDRDVVFADLFGDLAQEAVIFYTLGESNNDHKANILVLRPSGGGYVRFWENSFEASWGFAPPTGVYDLNKTGRPQIVAYRTVGASCPGVLDIYEYLNGAMRRLTGAWADNGQCQFLEIKDLDGDGLPEIIVRIRNYGVNQDIYRWNGQRYVVSNSRFPQYYNPELEELLKAASSPRITPASGRLQLAGQIVGMYIIQRRFDDAVAFCRALLETLQNPALTVSDRPPDQAKATVYRLLGDIYKAAGKSEGARKYYRRADALTRSKS
jgi:hypothetical protein